MRLVLHNFKCYRGTRTFEFFGDGVTLISGVSGAGKSSILEAICFALYGNVSKPITSGETTCRVTVVYLNQEITRTCRPNTVSLLQEGILYEHDDAQARISDFFGTYFDCLNYIPQQVHKTFLFTSAAEKLYILETLLFQKSIDLLPSELKRRCTERLRILTSQQDTLRGKIELIEQQLREFPQTMKTVVVCEPNIKINYRALFLRNKQRLYDNYIQKISLIEKELDILYGEIRAIPTEYIDYHSKWDNEVLRKHILAMEELGSFEWKNYSKFSEHECTEAIDGYMQDIQIVRQYETLIRTRQSIDFKPEILQNTEQVITDLEHAPEEMFVCPSCAASLVMVLNELRVNLNERPLISTDVKKQQLKVLKKERDELLRKRAIYDDISTQLSEIELPEDSLEVLTEQLKKWKCYRNYAHKISKFSSFICDPSLGLECARKELELNLAATEAQEAYSRLNVKLTGLQNYLDELKQAARVQNLCDCHVELSALEKQLANHELNIKLFEEQMRYQQTLLSLQDLQQSFKVINRRREATQALKSLISRAEMQYIQQTARDIEYLVNEYLSELFIEDPLIVKFVLFSESKTQGVKAQLDLEIFYKSMKCTPSMLSGGEQARLNICVTLALSKYFQGKILLLDECTAQLNQEASELVFDVLKRHTTCKTIVVAHQVVQGVFDEVLTI